ncbi:MAG: nicotinate-nucleotide--dimethylbenzimidazole phosphoribosyltransferase, partial [Syntrophobacterales bacterium]|nr:nicotinate-nucleotide--dimethylbenzimidazole phosphoribosyltransferase [Syntrophobacterales bacterium]
MELLKNAVKKIKPVEEKWAVIAQARLDSLTKPQDSLGRLEEFVRRLVGIARHEMPVLDKKVIFTFAGDHGVVEEGVSAFPKEVTPEMVRNFLNGGAGINVLARHAGSDVVVVDMGVDYDFGGVPGLVDRKIMRGTRNFVKGPAMTSEETVQCIEAGIELAGIYASKGYMIMGTGDMGIGNTTPSSAIAAVVTGRIPREVTGRGTGITDEGLAKKIAVIEAGIRFNRPDPKDGIDVLSKVGGTEIGGIAGLILGAASHRVPVVVDGLISTAGALIAYIIEPAVKDYIFAAHNSVEQGHRIMLETMGLAPILDLGLRLGEGTGAALAMILIEAGLKIYKEMTTFKEAGVSKAI